MLQRTVLELSMRHFDIMLFFVCGITGMCVWFVRARERPCVRQDMTFAGAQRVLCVVRHTNNIAANIDIHKWLINSNEYLHHNHKTLLCRIFPSVLFFFSFTHTLHKLALIVVPYLSNRHLPADSINIRKYPGNIRTFAHFLPVSY